MYYLAAKPHVTCTCQHHSALARSAVSVEYLGAGYCKERKALCPRDTNFQKVCRKTCEVCDKVPAPGAAAPPPRRDPPTTCAQNMFCAKLCLC